LSDADYRALADFRFQIRKFLNFSETAAHSEGLQPQQHQLLLATRVLTASCGPTIGELAEYLFIQHHSAVGLTDRLVERGLVERLRGGKDRRQVRIRLTPDGDRILTRLSSAHRVELWISGPRLVEALRALSPYSSEESNPNDDAHKTNNRNP
jgi:DNA-binding MarR family transcriptional regulator